MTSGMHYGKNQIKSNTEAASNEDQLDIFSVCVTANQPLEATGNLQSSVDSYERWFDHLYNSQLFERGRA